MIALRLTVSLTASLAFHAAAPVLSLIIDTDDEEQDRPDPPR